MREIADENSYIPEQREAQSVDDRLVVHFHLMPMENPRKSEKEGRPVFDDVEFIRIAIPGDKDTLVDRPASEMDKRRFALKYAAWKNGQAKTQSGMPLSEWAQVTRSQVEELAYFQVHTVEQLAGMADDYASRFRGVPALKQKAITYLEHAKGAAPVERMRAELERRDGELELLRRMLKQQGDAIMWLQTQKQEKEFERGPGSVNPNSTPLDAEGTPPEAPQREEQPTPRNTPAPGQPIGNPSPAGQPQDEPGRNPDTTPPDEQPNTGNPSTPPDDPQRQPTQQEPQKASAKQAKVRKSAGAR